jgi:hypothetical protein
MKNVKKWMVVFTATIAIGSFSQENCMVKADTTENTVSATESSTEQQNTDPDTTLSPTIRVDIDGIPCKTPKRVKIKKIKLSSKGCAKVYWSKVDCNMGYKLQYATKKDFSDAKTEDADLSTNWYIFAKSKQKYYVRVRAVSYGSHKWKRGKWSKVKVFQMK